MNLSWKGCATAGWSSKLAKEGEQGTGFPGMWKHILALSLCISFGFMWVADEWLCQECKRLKSTFPAFVLEVPLFPEDATGQGTDNQPLQISWEGQNFSHFLCVWVFAALVPVIPLHKAHQSQAQARDTPASRSCYSPSPGDTESPNLSSLSLCCPGNTQQCFRAEQEAVSSGRMWLLSPYKSIDEATLGLSLSFGFCQQCWLMLLQQSRDLQRQMGKCHSWQTKKEKEIVFLSFLMHQSVWLLQETLSPITMSHWEQHSTNSTAREIFHLLCRKISVFHSINQLISDLTIFWEIKWNGCQEKRGQGKRLGSAMKGFIIF